MPNLVTLEATQAEDEEEWFWAVKNLRWKEETEKIFERGKKNLRKQRTEERERERGRECTPRKETQCD